jgi:hypothetical protein
MFKKLTIVVVSFLIANANIFAQEAHTQEAPKVNTYPELKGYVGIVHPLYTFSSEGNTPNFRDYYIVGNPWGINIWKSKKVGLTFEFTPFIRFDGTGSKVSNYLFHPGVMYRLGKDFTFIARAAYETFGRYGFTPILSKVFKRYETHNFFAAILAPTRFGNQHEPSVTLSFQFGIGF